MSPQHPYKAPFQIGVVKTVTFLEKNKVPYLILGGLAVGVLGEARFTYDLDLDVFVTKQDLPHFLDKAKRASFKINIKEALENVEQFGTFRLFFQDLQIDMILASTELENKALERRQKFTLFGKKMWFPSVEDLILLKIIPGRPKDLMDAESIVARHKKRLDVRYLENWAKKLSDESENFKFRHILKSLLKK